MTLPNGQEYRVVDGPAIFNCDISTNPCEGKHIASFVGGARQGTLCWECAEAIYELVKNSRRRVPAEGKLRVEATV